ncbi:MAG: hypothetical protein WC325_09295 [Candidatus Bathyarchaeia archaeon]
MKRELTKKLANGYKTTVATFRALTSNVLKTTATTFRVTANNLLTNQLKLKSITNRLHFATLGHSVKKRKQTIIAVFLFSFFIFNVFMFDSIKGQLSYQARLQSSGTIRTVGVAAYMDSGCVTPVSSINWGTTSPGASISNTIYIKNEGTSYLTLSLNAANWNPSNAQNYLTLSWNYNGQAIGPNQVVLITLTLTVSQSITGIDSFNFEIIIVGTS